MADATDSKSADCKRSCGFDSHLRHQQGEAMTEQQGARADRETLMREHAQARVERASLTPGSPEWRTAAARVAAIEVEIAKISALSTPPARVARPEAKTK